MHEIDVAFRKQKEQLRLRRRRRRQRRLAAAAGLVVAVIAVAVWIGWTGFFAGGPGDAETAPETGTPALQETAEQAIYVPAIMELAGDPLTISIGGAGKDGPRLQTVPRPPELLQPGISDRLMLLADVMISSSERFMTTLPSSPADFAFFQAQNARPRAAESGDDPVFEIEPGADAGSDHPDTLEAVEEVDAVDDFELTPVAGQNDGGEAAELLAAGEIAPEHESLPVDPAGSSGALRQEFDATAEATGGWGARLGRSEGASLEDIAPTRIDNTTTVVEVMREIDRAPITEDYFVLVRSERTLDSIVLEYRFGQDDAAKVGEAFRAMFGRDSVSAGDVVALRGYTPDPRTARQRPVQISVYSGESYVGTLALGDDGLYRIGADPWVREDLFNYAGEAEEEGPKRRYRLLDAIYSTALRNNVPQGIIGEAIKYLTRAGYDLEAFANHDDRFVLLYSETPRDGETSSGRVLFAAIQGEGRDYRCFVFQARTSGEFGCLSENDEEQTLTITNGMVTPVNGVITSGFGPRRHPILKDVRIHTGVDWAAPVGTPVMAAFDGVIEFVGENGGYGNFIRIAHSGRRATGYAHLQRFAAGIRPGDKVKAGQIIGYVGSSGLSTGPHLHFELYQNGKPVNPLSTLVAGGSDGSAVEALVSRIIRVESAGDARAKNPLSTATGLGQFIESTWLRMMRTYRPDLFRSLSREDLLALRFDPELSREMVANLARESEAKLKAYGHQVTAGRLYLAHFLGVDGANRVLSADPAAPVETVVDPGVVPANPFLKGMTAADIVNWAERKMRGRGSRSPVVTTRRVARASPEFLQFKEAVAAILEANKAML
jgi:murein DD-endopeptidase MepM/ murein hydrolase activator NlpD